MKRIVSLVVILLVIAVLALAAYNSTRDSGKINADEYLANVPAV